MKTSKALTGLISALAFTTQTFAAATPSVSRDEAIREINALGLYLTINSTASVERAMEVFFPEQDLKEIKAFLAKKKVDLSGVNMSDAPFSQGMIYYGNKTAEFQKDFSLRIDGRFYRYDKKVSLAENFARLYNAFSGKHEAPPSSAFLKSILPNAAAQTSTVAEGMARSGWAAKHAAQMAPIEAWAKGPAFARPTAARTSPGLAARAGAAASRLAPVARAAGSLHGIARIAGLGAASSLMIWAAAAAGALRMGNEIYADFYHGKLTCSKTDPDTGRANYVFSFTGSNTWYWRSTDTRTFTPDEMSEIFQVPSFEQCLEQNSNNREACERAVKDELVLPYNCTDAAAARLTKNRIAGAEAKINDIKGWRKEGGASSPAAQ